MNREQVESYFTQHIPGVEFDFAPAEGCPGNPDKPVLYVFYRAELLQNLYNALDGLSGSSIEQFEILLLPKVV